MHETIHRWDDGYGASITFTLVHGLAGTPTANPFAYVIAEAEANHGGGSERFTTAPADVMVGADDLRSLAAAALAMADALDAEAVKQ